MEVLISHPYFPKKLLCKAWVSTKKPRTKRSRNAVRVHWVGHPSVQDGELEEAQILRLDAVVPMPGEPGSPLSIPMTDPWWCYINGVPWIHQYTPVMLAYMPAPWILWDMGPLSRYGGQKILTSCILESHKNGGTVKKYGKIVFGGRDLDGRWRWILRYRKAVLMRYPALHAIHLARMWRMYSEGGVIKTG